MSDQLSSDSDDFQSEDSEPFDIGDDDNDEDEWKNVPNLVCQVAQSLLTY
jgi:hypothetical protein